jgi:hypothetical protein
MDLDIAGATMTTEVIITSFRLALQLLLKRWRTVLLRRIG